MKYFEIKKVKETVAFCDLPKGLSGDEQLLAIQQFEAAMRDYQIEWDHISTQIARKDCPSSIGGVLVATKTSQKIEEI